MNQLVAGQLDEMAPNSWCVLCLRSNWQCVLCFKLGEMRNNSGVFCRQDWLFLAVFRCHREIIFEAAWWQFDWHGNGFRIFSDICWFLLLARADGSARYKVKFHHQRCDHCNKVNRGADDQVMKVGAHMETILGIFRRAWFLIKKKPWKIGHIFDKWISFHLREYNSTVSRALNRLVL